MASKSSGHLPPISLARRHFVGVMAAGVGRLSAIAVATSVLLGNAKDANALGIFPRGAPGTHPNCFKRGTLILTANGEVAVEDLAKGDLVVTANGALPIRWVGRKTYTKNASVSWHPSVLPIRISRFAINDQTPQRDFYLSQEHCLLIGGVLIPAKHLVNEGSITIDEDARMLEVIEYFCVELDTHEVIFAEGVAAESFRYAGRIVWDNLGEYEDLYGNEHKVIPACAPICRYDGGRAELNALLRLAASRFVDVRDPIQIAYGRILARAIEEAA